MAATSIHDLLAQISAAELRGDLLQAEALCRLVLAEAGDQADLWRRLASVLDRVGRTGDACAALQRALALDPANAECLHALGTTHQALGDLHAASECLQRALALDPANATACLCLADALMDMHHYEQALATYRRALALRSPFPEAHHNLAAALLHLGQVDAAVTECRQAIAERPGHAPALNTLGVALARSGRREEALAALQQAVYHQPHYANAYHNLGNVLDQAGHVDQAIHAYRAALAINPGLEEARYDLAALGEGPPPPCTPRAYVMRLFDTYSTSFDQHLVEQLDYHVPELLYEAVIQTGPASGLDVIDLGCGTGLVGKVFRGLARRLIGVDVSPGMIHQAERRQVYDQLLLDDVIAYLRARQEPCDLVLAADVFIYLGDLTPVFAAVARLLRPRGLFAFSLETTDRGDYVLQAHRRYAQSPAYIQRLADHFALATAALGPVKLRRHESGDAQGQIVVLHRLA
jgi:predicted TPR repeat methyltransferase